MGRVQLIFYAIVVLRRELTAEGRMYMVKVMGFSHSLVLQHGRERGCSQCWPEIVCCLGAQVPKLTCKSASVMVHRE